MGELPVELFSWGPADVIQSPLMSPSCNATPKKVQPKSTWIF